MTRVYLLNDAPLYIDEDALHRIPARTTSSTPCLDVTWQNTSGIEEKAKLPITFLKIGNPL